jgi:hypothetical protein
MGKKAEGVKEWKCSENIIEPFLRTFQQERREISGERKSWRAQITKVSVLDQGDQGQDISLK